MTHLHISRVFSFLPILNKHNATYKNRTQTHIFSNTLKNTSLFLSHTTHTHIHIHTHQHTLPYYTHNIRYSYKHTLTHTHTHTHFMHWNVLAKGEMSTIKSYFISRWRIEEKFGQLNRIWQIKRSIAKWRPHAITEFHYVQIIFSEKKRFNALKTRNRIRTHFVFEYVRSLSLPHLKYSSRNSRLFFTL